MYYVSKKENSCEQSYVSSILTLISLWGSKASEGRARKLAHARRHDAREVIVARSYFSAGLSLGVSTFFYLFCSY